MGTFSQGAWRARVSIQACNQQPKVSDLQQKSQVTMGASFSPHALTSSCTNAHQNSKVMRWQTSICWALWLVLNESGIACVTYESNAVLQGLPIAFVQDHPGGQSAVEAPPRTYFTFQNANFIWATIDVSEGPTPVIKRDGGKRHGEMGQRFSYEF
jgi:hypothetical protein